MNRMQASGSGILRSRRGLALGLLALVLLLQGCTRIGLVYNHLHALAGFQLRDFVSLEPAQKQQYDAAFHALWRWHRSSQLPVYAERLRALAQLGQQPLTPQQLDAVNGEAAGYGRLLGEKLLDTAAPLVANFSDAQVQSVIGEMDRRVEKSRRKRAKLSEDRWVEQLYDDAEDRLEDWAGSVTPEQKQRLERWAESLRPLHVRELDDSGYQPWRAQLLQLLQARSEPDFAEKLRGFVFTEEPPGEAQQLRRDAARELVVDLSASATPQQRAYFKRKLDELAAELEKLSREPE